MPRKQKLQGIQGMQKLTRIQKCQESQSFTERKGCRNAKFQRIQKFVEFKN